MSYAINAQRTGWRAVNSVSDLLEGESFSDERPQLAPILPTSTELIEAKKREVRAMREGVLNRLAGIALAAQLTSDQPTVDAYLIARQGLLDLTKDLPDEPESVELVMFGRYQAIVYAVQTTAPNLITAFAGVDM